MEVTGYQLREALKRWQLKLDTSAKQFKESLYQFDEDQGAQGENFNPSALSSQFEVADAAIATLEAAQQRYNQQVEVNILGEKMPLAVAIKRVGGAGRLEKMWRGVASDTGRDRYSYREMTRDKDQIRAKRTISVQDSIKFADEAARKAGALRSAIATANNTKVDLSEVTDDLL